MTRFDQPQTKRNLLQYILEEVEAGDFVFTGSNITLDCPFCKKDGHFGVHAFKKLYNCFKCSVSGKVNIRDSADLRVWRRVLRAAQAQEEPEADQQSQVISVLPFWPLRWTREWPAEVPKPSVPRPSDAQANQGTAYLIKRGISISEIENYHVSMAFSDPRVYFPYWNEDRQLTFWMGRLYLEDPDLPKTREPGHPAIKPLFGTHVYPRESFKDICVLVEGVFDHLATPHSLALMGSSLSHHQLEQLKSLGPKKTVILLDPDAKDKSLRILRTLMQNRIPSVSVCLRTDKDPADLGKFVMKDIVSRLRDVRPAVRSECLTLPV